MSLELSMVVPHVPSICHEDQAPEFQRNIVESMKELGNQISELKPDAIVLISCHWPSTFTHYVDVTPVHKGMLTAMEAPELIKDVPYHYPGDLDLGMKLVQAGQDANIQVLEVNDSNYVWDYGTLVPLRYLVPKADIPIVNLCVTLTSDLDETYRWGKAIRKVINESEKRIVFVASGALSHNLVRGRHNKPTTAEHALDKEFVDLIMKKEYKAAHAMLPEFARFAKVESGGRHLAMLFAMIDDDFEPAYFSDAQSSGSWNPVITFTPTKVSGVKEKADEEYAK